MAAAETARLIASLELQDKNFTRGIRNVERGVNRVDRKLGAFSGFINRNMGRAIDSIGVRLVSSIGTGLEELATLEDATTSVTGAINQMGLSGKVTADQVATWANEIEAATDAAFDDKDIVAATATLIRYGGVTEKNLRPAMEIITDLAAKTGDVESASTKLAKALADPTKATRILREVGVRLTKSEEKRLKQLVRANKLGEAQALILELVGEKTKGAAEASGGPYRDALKKLADAGEDLRRSFAIGLLPVFTEVADVLTTELAKPSTLNALKGIGKALAETLRSLISSARKLPWDAIGNALTIAGAGAKAVLDAFLGLPPWIQTAVLTGWGLNKLTGGALSGIFTGLASGLIKGVLGMTAGVVHIKAGTVVGGGGTPVPAGGGKGGPLGLGLKGVGGLVVGLTGVGIAAALASEFEDEIQGLSTDIGQAWRDWLKTSVDIDFPKLDPKDLEWPFGPKNTPSILPEVFGGNGLLGGTPGTPNEKWYKPPPGKGPPSVRVPPGIKPSDIKPVVTNLQRLNTKSDSQKSELANIKNASATLNTSITTQTAQQTAELANISTAITTLPSALQRQAAANQAANQASLAGGREASVTDKPAIDAVKTAVTNAGAVQKAELGNIKNAMATLGTKTDGVKTGIATMDANQKAVTLAQTAVNAIGNLLSIGQSTSQVLAAGNTTSAVNVNASATRGVAPPIVSTLLGVSSAITTAIYAARPVIQSTTVVNRYSSSQRGGSTSGSRYAGGRVPGAG